MNIENILNNTKYKNHIISINDDINSNNDNDNNNNNSINENKNIFKCLISDEIINDKINQITLPCKHTFDYYNLYQEIYNQKFYHYKINTIKLNTIKCPYCRQIFDGVLPYQEVKHIKPINGINDPYSKILNIYKCEFIGKKSKEPCNCKANLYKDGIFCNRHYKLINKRKEKNLNDVKQYNRCKAILKTGKNKGNLCNCIIKDKSEKLYCKKHLKLNKEINING